MFNILIQGLWVIASVMIFFCGIYFSVKLKFIHMNFKEMISAILEKSDGKDRISSFQSLTIALAGRIGVGSLAGIALAVFGGGPGVLFWIWLVSLLCATSTFAESVLAVVFRKKDVGNIYLGGPFYYIKEGLGKKALAMSYATIILLSFIIGSVSIQVNSMSRCIGEVFNISPLIFGIIIAVITGITIFGGVKKIALTTSSLVPIMTVFYLLICLYIIITNIGILPNILIDIINSACNFKAFGLGVISTLLIGMQKGIFSSEVGLGTGSIAAVTADTKNPCKNGLVQVFGIHIENLLIATITVIVICMSNYQNLNINDINGIEIILEAFSYHMGNFGPILLTITITLFGLATIMAGYYYGESSLKFIKKTNKIDIIFFKILTLFAIVLGSKVSSTMLWDVIDVMTGIIAVINIYALFKLRAVVIEEYNYYRMHKE